MMYVDNPSLTGWQQKAKKKEDLCTLKVWFELTQVILAKVYMNVNISAMSKKNIYKKFEKKIFTLYNRFDLANLTKKIK